MSWSKSFADPIELPNGRVLRTLRDAGHYVTGLSKADQSKPHWQIAAHELMMAAERGGIPVLAEIAVRQALAHGQPKPATAPRKKAVKKYKLIRSAIHELLRGQSRNSAPQSLLPDSHQRFTNSG